MAMAAPIIQIVGYQNSGKTTLISQLVTDLSKRGLAVAVLKHHGHGGHPALTGDDKDSTKHFQSGAIVSAVEGDGVLHVMARHDRALADNLSLLQSFQPDLIIIEGYKQEAYPKIVMVRNEQDARLIHQLEAVMAVVYWPESKANAQANEATITAFQLADNHIAQWLQETLHLSNHVDK